MKALLKIGLFSVLISLASCSHMRHHGCKNTDNCKMEKGSKECKECCEKGQCEMKPEEKKEAAK